MSSVCHVIDKDLTESVWLEKVASQLRRESEVKPGFSSACLDTFIYSMQRLPDPSRGLLGFGLMLETLSQDAPFKSPLVRRLALESLHVAKKQESFSTKDPHVGVWLKSLNRVISQLSLSPIFVDFLRSHSELQKHQDFYVRLNSVQIMCTFEWTFNQIDQCLLRLQELASSVSSETLRTYESTLQIPFLVAHYMNGELDLVLQMAEKMEKQAAEEKREGLHWLHVIQAACHTFLGNTTHAGLAIKKAKLQANGQPKPGIDVMIGELSHLIYTEKFDEAQEVLKAAESLLDQHFGPFVYHHIVVSLYKVIVAIRTGAHRDQIMNLAQNVRRQAEYLPADRIYVDMLEIYLKKYEGREFAKSFLDLQKVMGPGVPATFRMKKGLADQW